MDTINRRLEPTGNPARSNRADRPGLGDEGELMARLRAAHGRARVAEVLHSLALDVLGPSSPGDLRAVDWDALCTLVLDPVETAASAALETLARELEAATDGVPEPVRARLDWLRARAGLGHD